MSTTSLSPEARNLLKQAQEWLVGKNPHWITGMWGRVVGENGVELDLEDIEAILDKDWKGVEWETEYDENGDYIYSAPFRDVEEPTDGCLLTGLLVANNYKDDKTFQEARDFLAELVRKSNPDFYTSTNKESVIIEWNDARNRTIDDVKNLFRRAFYRLGGK